MFFFGMFFDKLRKKKISFFFYQLLFTTFEKQHEKAEINVVLF